MSEKSKIIVIKESLVQSLIADMGTFGFLLLCIWASWKTDNLFWQFLLGTMGLMWVISRVTTAFNSGGAEKFRSYEEAHKWLGEQIAP